MNNFKIKFYDETGNIKTEILEAENKKQLLFKLKQTNKIAVSIEKIEQNKINKKKIKYRDLRNFFYQLSILTKSGLSINECWSELSADSFSPYFNVIIKNLKDKTFAGEKISDILMKYKDVIPEICINIVKIGEVTGKLQQAFYNNFNYINLKMKMKNKLLSIIAYPLILLLFTMFFFWVVVIYVLPNIINLFSDIKLPLITELVIKFSDILKEEWYVFVILFIILFFVLKHFLKNKKFLFYLENMVLKIPFVNKVYLQFILIDFSNIFYLLLENKIEILTSIKIVSQSSVSYFIQSKKQFFIDHIQKGDFLWNTLDKLNFFPSMYIKIIKSAEKSNELETTFKQLKEIYEDEFNTKIEVLSSFLEPILMLIVGGIVLFLILSVLLPIWKMNLIK